MRFQLYIFNHSSRTLSKNEIIMLTLYYFRKAVTPSKFSIDFVHANQTSINHAIDIGIQAFGIAFFRY